MRKKKSPAAEQLLTQRRATIHLAYSRELMNDL
jgi:hypothetical protein